ncbi:MAG TPA: MATE family efflux transporter [Candidatus Rikenella faecigallinarum]|uniref:Multidrug export protein MepA n=1 Tax=Candidatus Rikenella faecigallinarum TaxID=2838745 RepID=A0A9D1QAX1_9BACT|nr:MATE family efflux transporter [Candidatus Rikenella faecigallinarum]
MTQQASPQLLGTEKISTLLLRYAIPAIIAMTASSLYNLVDSIFIGRGVGALALSGLSITMPLMNLGAAFGSLVGIGASTQLAIKLGQNDQKSAQLILGNVIILNILIGLAYTAICLPLLDPILYFFGASENTIGYARSYMWIILAGNVVTHVYLGLNDMLRASGYPGRAMGIMLTAVILNCILNGIFIFGFGWGIAGAAWATIVAQVVAMSLELNHFLNPKHFIHFKRNAIRLKGSIVRAILSIGMAPFLMYVCSSVIVILINKSLMQHGGDLYIGAYGVVNRIVMLFVMVVMGLNQGMQPIVGYNFGARKFDRVNKTLKYVIFCAVSVTTTGFIVCELFPQYITMLFTDDAELIDISSHGLRIVLAMFPFVGFQMVTSNFFQSIGMAPKAIFLSLTRQLIFLVPFLLILPEFFGANGVWMSMPLADTAATTLAAILLWRQFRKFHQLHLQDQALKQAQ